MSTCNQQTVGTNIQGADTYGNMGENPTPTWQEEWMRWEPQDRSRYLAEVAHWSTLDFGHMRQMLQDMLPMNNRWISDSESCLREYEPIVGRLKEEIERGAIPKNLTPEEFAAWCDAMNVELPIAFVDALKAKAKAKAKAKESMIEDEQILQSPIKISYASWIPLPQNFTAKAKTPEIQDTEEAEEIPPNDKVLIYDGRKIILEAARRGVNMTIPEVAKELQKASVGMRKKDIQTIIRRLKGQLPIDEAQAIAAQVRNRNKEMKSQQP